eukprot:6973486-Pyramimonas_sp.AAC.1
MEVEEGAKLVAYEGKYRREPIARRELTVKCRRPTQGAHNPTLRGVGEGRGVDFAPDGSALSAAALVG